MKIDSSVPFANCKLLNQPKDLNFMQKFTCQNFVNPGDVNINIFSFAISHHLNYSCQVLISIIILFYF